MSKLNTNSNAYIIIYSTILVVIVAFLLAFVFQALKPMQDANVALDVKKQILNSLNLRGLDGQEAEAKYAEVVKEEKEINGLKVFACQVGDQEVVVVSLKGMGLWGGISGYLAVDKDDKVYGAYFNHESETAGLGAEIKDSQEWQEKFIGKKIYDENGNVVLSVVKKVEDAAAQVDCVTGATLTSNGVDAMIKDCLKNIKKAEEYGIDWMDGMPLTLEMIRTFYDADNLEAMLEDLAQKRYVVKEHPKRRVKVGNVFERIEDPSLPIGYNIVAGKMSFEVSKVLSPDEPAPTLVAMDMQHLYVVDGDGIRNLSLREGLSLFGYPNGFKFDVPKDLGYDLLGNTVVVPVIKEVAGRVIDVYKREKEIA